MAQVIKLKRSGTISKRILPSGLEEGELFLNYNSAEPGLFFRDNSSPQPRLRKVGSAHVGANAPNSAPPEGFTTTVSEGELWYVTNPDDPNYQNLVIYVGGEWKPAVSFVEQIP
jgi:hypothetical protein